MSDFEKYTRDSQPTLGGCLFLILAIVTAVVISAIALGTFEWRP